MARDKLKKKISTYQEGVAIRKQEVEQAKIAMAKDEAELSKLQSEEKILKKLVDQLKGILGMSYSYKVILISSSYKTIYFLLWEFNNFGKFLKRKGFSLLNNGCKNFFFLPSLLSMHFLGMLIR